MLERDPNCAGACGVSASDRVLQISEIAERSSIAVGRYFIFGFNRTFLDFLERRFGGAMMSRIQRKFVESCLLILLLLTLFLVASIPLSRKGG